mmetsp:Transcript_17055/g.42305  ORF Transcript_17055/g.42305 Transcript_17055/m.42305 type:complete len:235 (-) Transcript_17055:1589-2293(-)
MKAFSSPLFVFSTLSRKSSWMCSSYSEYTIAKTRFVNTIAAMNMKNKKMNPVQRAAPIATSASSGKFAVVPMKKYAWHAEAKPPNLLTSGFSVMGVVVVEGVVGCSAIKSSPAAEDVVPLRLYPLLSKETLLPPALLATCSKEYACGWLATRASPDDPPASSLFRTRVVYSCCVAQPKKMRFATKSARMLYQRGMVFATAFTTAAMKGRVSIIPLAAKVMRCSGKFSTRYFRIL